VSDASVLRVCLDGWVDACHVRPICFGANSGVSNDRYWLCSGGSSSRGQVHRTIGVPGTGIYI